MINQAQVASLSKLCSVVVSLGGYTQVNESQTGTERCEKHARVYGKGRKKWQVIVPATEGKWPKTEQAILKHSDWMTFLQKVQALSFIICTYKMKISTNMKMFNPYGSNVKLNLTCYFTMFYVGFFSKLLPSNGCF